MRVTNASCGPCRIDLKIVAAVVVRLEMVAGFAGAAVAALALPTLQLVH